MQERIQALRQKLIEFRDKRDWKQFHTMKDLSLGLGIEAAELQELFLWKSEEEISQKVKEDKEYLQAIREETADVLNYLLLISERFGFDLVEAGIQKLEKNEVKYPVQKSKGKNLKYTELR